MEQVSLMNTIGIYVHDVSPGSACSCGGEPICMLPHLLPRR